MIFLLLMSNRRKLNTSKFRNVTKFLGQKRHRKSSILSRWLRVFFTFLAFQWRSSSHNDRFWQFQISPIFWPSDLVIWPLTYIVNVLLATTKIHTWFNISHDWANGATCISHDWANGATCFLLTTFIQTNKQVDKQTVIREYTAHQLCGITPSMRPFFLPACGNLC